MTKLLLIPSQSGFAAQAPEDAKRIELDGGTGRYRRDFIGKTSMVNVQFWCNASKFNYFWAFYRSETSRGGLPFTLDMILESATITTYTAYFVPGSIRSQAFSADYYNITCQLEVVPLAENSSADDAIIAAFVP